MSLNFNLSLGKKAKEGQITQDTFKGCIKKEQIKNENLLNIFNAIDDGDGILDQNEIEKFKEAVMKAAGDDNLSDKEAAKLLKSNNIKEASAEDLYEFLNELNQASANIKSSVVQQKGDNKTILITYNDGTTEIINPDKTKEIQTSDGKKTVKNSKNEVLFEEVTDEEGNVTQTFFEKGVKSKSVTTGKGGNPVTTTFYDESGKPVKTEKQNGASLEEYTYEDGSDTPKLLKNTENKGIPAKEKTTEYTYNGDEVTETSVSNGRQSVVVKNGDKILSSTVTENGKTTVKTQTDNGFTEIITDDANPENVITNTYNNDAKKLSSTKTENGETYKAEYDGNGNTKIVIQNGESLETIAKKFGCTVEQLIEVNGGNIRGWAGDVIVVPTELAADDKKLQGRQTSDEAENAYKVVADQIKKEEDDVNARKTIEYSNHDYETFEDLAKGLFAQEGIENPNKRQLAQRIEELKKNNPDLKDGELKGAKINAPVSPEIYEKVTQEADSEKALMAQKAEAKENERIAKEQVKAEAAQIVNDLKEAAKIGKKGTDVGLGTNDELLKKTISSIKSPEVLAEVERQIAEIPGMVYGKRYEADNEHSALETFLASEVGEDEVNDLIKTMISNGALKEEDAVNAKARMAVKLITDGGDGMGTDCDKIKEGIKEIDSPEVLKAVNDLISKHSSGWSLWTKSSSLQDYLKGEMWNSEIKYLDGLMAQQGALEGDKKTDAAYNLLREAVEGAGTNIEYLEKALQTIKSPEDRKALEAKLDEYIKEKGIKKQYEGQSSLQAIMYDECDGFGGVGTDHDEIKKFNEMMIKQGAYTDDEALALRAEGAALQAAEGDYDNILTAVKDIKDQKTLDKFNEVLKSKNLGSIDKLISDKLSETDALKIKGHMAINQLMPENEAIETSLKLIQSGDFDTMAIGLAAIRTENSAVEIDKKLKENGTSLKEVMQKFNTDKAKYANRGDIFKLFADFSILGNRDFFNHIANEYKENTDMTDDLYVEGKESNPLTDEQKEEYASVTDIFDDTLNGAKAQMQQIKDGEGVVSEFVDDMRDRGGLMGKTRRDISERLKYDEESQRLYKLAAEGKLTRVDAQGNVHKVTFEEIFKERQGVEYDKAKIDEVKNQSVNMAALSMVKGEIDETLYKLNQGLNSNDSASLQRGILSSLDTLSELSGQEIDLKALGYEISTVKEGETVEGSFGAKYISKNGKPLSLDELKQLAAQMKSSINTSYASVLGVEIPEGASDKDIEKLLDKSYEDKMDSFKDLYKEAFGKEAPDEMIDSYVTSQTYGKMATGAVVTIAAVVAAPFTGGTSLAGALGVSTGTAAAIAAGAGAAAASLMFNGLEAATDANGWTDNEIANNTSQALVDGALTALGFKVGQYADEVAKAGKIIAQLKALGYEVSSDMASSTLAELIQNNGEVTKDGFIQNMIFSLAGNAAGRVFSNVTDKIAHVKDADTAEVPSTKAKPADTAEAITDTETPPSMKKKDAVSNNAAKPSDIKGNNVNTDGFEFKSKKELEKHYKKMIPGINDKELKYLTDQMERIRNGEPRWLGTEDEEGILRSLSVKARKKNYAYYKNRKAMLSEKLSLSNIPIEKMNLNEREMRLLDEYFNFGTKHFKGENLDELNALFEKIGTVLEEDTILYRGVSTRGELGLNTKNTEFLNSIKEGSVIGNEDMHYSTSNNPNVADGYGPNRGLFEQGYILKINVPKGTKVVDMRHRRPNVTRDTGEFVLPQGVQLKVTKIDYETGVVECEYIPPKTSPSPTTVDSASPAAANSDKEVQMPEDVETPSNVKDVNNTPESVRSAPENNDVNIKGTDTADGVTAKPETLNADETLNAPVENTNNKTDVKPEKQTFIDRLKNKVKSPFSSNLSFEQKQVLSDVSERLAAAKTEEDFNAIQTSLAEIPECSQKSKLLKQIDVKMEALGFKINYKPVTTVKEAEKIYKSMVEDRMIGNAVPEDGKPIFWNKGGQDWMYAMHKGGEKPQGTPWKIHLYADNPQEWANVAQIAMPYLNENGIAYKTILGMDDFEVLRNTLTNDGMSTQQGKSFTVYFESEEEFLKAAQDLEKRFKASGLKSSGTVSNEGQIGDSGFISYRHEGAERGVQYKPDNIEDPYLKMKGADTHTTETAAETAEELSVVADESAVQNIVKPETLVADDTVTPSAKVEIKEEIKMSEAEQKQQMVLITKGLENAKNPRQINNLQEMLDALPNSQQKNILQSQLDAKIESLKTQAASNTARSNNLKYIMEAEKQRAENIKIMMETMPNCDMQFANELADIMDWKPDIAEKLMELATKSGRRDFEIFNLMSMADENNIDDIIHLCKNDNIKFEYTDNGELIGNDFETVLHIANSNPEYKSQLMDIAANSNRKKADIYNIAVFMKKYPDNADDIASLTKSNANIKVGYNLNGELSTNIDDVMKALKDNPDMHDEIMDYMSVQRRAANDTTDPAAQLAFHIETLKTYPDLKESVLALSKDANLDAVSIRQFVSKYKDNPEILNDVLFFAKKGYTEETINRNLKNIEKYPELRETLMSETPQYKLIDNNVKSTSQEVLEKRFAMREKVETIASEQLEILNKTLGDNFYAKVKWEDIIPENASPAEIKSILEQLNDESKFFARTYVNEFKYGKNIQWAHEMNIISEAAQHRIANGDSFEDVLNNIADDYKSYDEATTLNSDKDVSDRRKFSGLFRGDRPDSELGKKFKLGAYTPFDQKGGYSEYYDRFAALLDKPRKSPYPDVTLTQLETNKKLGNVMKHPLNENVNPGLAHVKERYNELAPLFEKVKNGGTLTAAEKAMADDKIAEMYFLLGNIMPWDRGSNGISDIFMRSMYKNLGIDMPALKPGVSLDLEAFCMDMDEYKAKWHTFFED